jgi:hypothetical protein
VGNFINNNITDNVGIHLDSYGRAWIGSNGEHIKMVSSERFGDINKVTINVYSPNNNNFNEVDYYKELLGVFDLNCCMAGLDRINNKIIYTEQFIDFLFTHKIEVTNTSIATSGNYEKFVMIGNQKYSHTINPKTGMPIKGIKSITTICPYAEFADAIATPIMIMGIENGLNMVNQIKGLECIIFDDNDHVFVSNNIHSNN